MNKLPYIEQDQEGLHTLEAVGRAHKFNRWMYQQVQPWMGGKILEIGSGIGNLSEFFLDDGADITLSDIRKHYCDELKRRFSGHKSLKEVVVLDLVHPDFDQQYASYFNTYDSAFALNVVEHIEDDTLAMQNLYKLLKPGGRVLILVPAGPALYNGIDRSLLHFRRYRRQELESLFIRTLFKPERTWMFNALGIPAWWFSGTLLRNHLIGDGQMDTYDKLVPLAKILDKLVFNKIGLSVITLGQKVK